MSKKNGKSRERRSQSGREDNTENEQVGQPTNESTPTPRKKLTVPERFVAKSNNIHELVKDVLAIATFYGASPEIVTSTQNLLVEVDSWRGDIKALVDDGWQPVVKGKLKELAEGDKICIAQESKELYSYLPKDAALVVGKIIRSENGRIKRVLLVDEASIGVGAPPEGLAGAYGWAQLSHLERR